MECLPYVVGGEGVGSGSDLLDDGAALCGPLWVGVGSDLLDGLFFGFGSGDDVKKVHWCSFWLVPCMRA